jgi:hypothetical protein
MQHGTVAVGTHEFRARISRAKQPGARNPLTDAQLAPSRRVGVRAPGIAQAARLGEFGFFDPDFGRVSEIRQIRHMPGQRMFPNQQHCQNSLNRLRVDNRSWRPALMH